MLSNYLGNRPSTTTVRRIALAGATLLASAAAVIVVALAPAAPTHAGGAAPARLQRGITGTQSQQPGSAAVAAQGALGMLRGTFPGVAPKLGMNASFTSEERAVAGRQVAGWRTDAALAAPAGLAPLEREAWLARASHGGRSAGFGIFFPASYGDPGMVTIHGLHVVQAPVDAHASTGAVVDGKLVYVDAYQSTDAIQVVRPGEAEEYLLLRDERAPARFATELCAAEGAPALAAISPHAGGLTILDRAGHRAEVGAPYVIDARGVRSDSAASWQVVEQGPGRFAITLALDAAGLAYPLVIDPTWTEYGTSGSAAGARYAHTATQLADGSVLVVGGVGSDGTITGSCALYSGGAWTTTGSLNQPRDSHTATLLPDGDVLVAGGTQFGEYQASCEIYHAGTWTVTGSLTTGRYNHTATLLADGDVLVAAGQGMGGSGLLNSCEIYHAGAWTATGALGTGRINHTATLLNDGTVLVVGGMSVVSGSFVYLDSCELFDGSTWSPAAGLGTSRAFHTATLLNDGTVLVAGGRSDLALLTATLLFQGGSWSQVGSLNTARMFHTATKLADGSVLVAGGDDNIDTPTTEIYRYQFWTPSGNLNEDRLYSAASLLADGTVLVSFGYSEYGDAMPSWEIFTPPQAITIIGPSPLMVPATSASGAVVTYPTVAIVDPNDPNPTITFFPPNGSLFPIGTSYATIRVTDAEGGSNQAGIMIIVTSPVPVTVNSSTETYDGAPQSVTSSTVPAGLATTTTYNGSTTLPTEAGAYAVVVTVTDPRYAGQGTGMLTITMASQSIIFPAIGTVAYGATPPTLTATASSGLPVTFSVLSGPATIVNGALVASATGTVVVAADQAGNGDYLAATEVTQTVTVGIGSQTITFPAVGTVIFGATPPTLAATASSGLPVTFSVLSGPATIVDGTLVASATGTVVVAADQAGDADYKAAPEVTQSVIVYGSGDKQCGKGSGSSGVASAAIFLLLRLALRQRKRRVG